VSCVLCLVSCVVSHRCRRTMDVAIESSRQLAESVSGGGSKRRMHKSLSTSSLSNSRRRIGAKNDKTEQSERPLETVKTDEIRRPFTLYDYLVLELTDTHYRTFSQDKVEHLLNVIKVPAYLERVVFFGMCSCFETFLYTFTILPLRGCLAIHQLLRSFKLSTARKADLLKGLLLVMVLGFILRLDTSKIYHNIRGQAAIKLYVMFNVLEIADKLCAALGQDILECLFSATSLNNFKRLAIFSLLMIVYCTVHCVVLLYQIITLNVAVNSYSNALLTLLLSNQFAEVKSAVFKKFERENLFQLTCADITERFQLLVMLLLIGVRNIVEVNNIGVVPTSWAGWNRWLGALFGPAVVVVGSEVAVDWIKHAYIVKFNNIRPKVYRKFLDVLALDYADHAFSDHIMTKRTGLPVYPLAVVTAKMLFQSYSILADQSEPNIEILASSTPTAETFDNLIKRKLGFKPTEPMATPPMTTPTTSSYGWLNLMLVGITVYLVLLFVKLVLGVLLLKYTSRRHAIFRRYRSRPSKDFLAENPKGYGVVELDEMMTKRMYEPEEEVPPVRRESSGDGVTELLSVTRFKMAAKRIW
jgi:hypothetical protein